MSKSTYHIKETKNSYSFSYSGDLKEAVEKARKDLDKERENPDILSMERQKVGRTMGINTGYLTAGRKKENDENYTPYYAAEVIIKYIPKSYKIWLPFDEEWSAFYQLFKRAGYDTIRSSITDGLDFFVYEPDSYDAIVSNPPFSQKDKVLERLYKLQKPFAILLPLDSIQGRVRYKYFKQGIQLLSFDKRVNYHTPENMQQYAKGAPFASAYFCRGILPKDLILEELQEYEKPLTEA